MTMRIQFWRTSLVARLVLYFLLLSLLTTILLAAIAFFQARSALRESVLDRIEVTVTLKEEALRHWGTEQVRDLLALVQPPSLQHAVKALMKHEESTPERQAAYLALSEILVPVAEQQSEWQEIILLSPKGKVLFSTDRSHEGDYRVLDRFFVQGQQGTYVQKIYPSPITHQPTITIATPVGGEPGGRPGVLAVHLNLERMDRILLESTGLGAGSESYLVDRFNVFVSAQRFGREEFPRGVHSQGIDAAVNGGAGSGVYANYRGEPVIGVYCWLEELDAALLVEEPQREAFAPARRLAGMMLAVSLVLSAGLTGGIFLLARQIARPVLRISRATVRVAEGDLYARAPVTTADEIGVLARNFNQMTDRLRALYGDLEQQIAVRRKAEKERERLIRELEAKNTELERFTHTVSHDLKSPLLTIRGFLGLLRKDAARGDAVRVEFDVERIGSAVETMRQLLDGLLALSRAGRVVNEPRQVSLANLVREGVDLVAGQIAERGVEVVVAPELPVVCGDPLRLRQVVQNLIDNAVKFMDVQPQPRIEIGADRDGEQIVCYVRDNGMGIEPRDQEKIFGLFDRLDAAPGGVGIGLALVRRIVEVHGGRVWVESEGRGKGATFYFSLPPGKESGADLNTPRATPPLSV